MPSIVWTTSNNKVLHQCPNCGWIGDYFDFLATIPLFWVLEIENKKATVKLTIDSIDYLLENYDTVTVAPFEVCPSCHRVL
jgi:hypothetical protein